MKKVGVCVNCKRQVYTNDLNLCKRCYQEVGIEFLKQQEAETLDAESSEPEEIKINQE